MLVKLSAVRTRVRELTNTDTSAPTNHHITDIFLNACINRWRRRLYDKSIQACPGDFDTEVDIAVQANTAYYGAAQGFPSDYYRALGVWANDGSQGWTRLTRFEHLEDLDWIFEYESNSGGNSADYCYRIQNGRGRLELRPKPTTAGDTIRIRYAPTLADLVGDNDPLDSVNGWEDWVIYRTCLDVAIRRKLSQDLVQLYAAQASAIEDDIDRMVDERDQGAVDRIVDVRRDLEPLPYLWGKYVP